MSRNFGNLKILYFGYDLDVWSWKNIGHMCCLRPLARAIELSADVACNGYLIELFERCKYLLSLVIFYCIVEENIIGHGTNVCFYAV